MDIFGAVNPTNVMRRRLSDCSIQFMQTFADFNSRVIQLYANFFSDGNRPGADGRGAKPETA